MAAGRSGPKTTEELELYRGFVDRFFDHNLSGFFGVRDSEKRLYDAAGIGKLWQGLARDIRAGRGAERIDMYVGIPFCERLCGFCNLDPEKLGARARVREYLDWLAGSIDYFAPAFSGLRLNNLLVGGGTPSVLSPAELERLFGALFARFRFQPAGERSFEFHPSSFSGEKLELLERFGFNRIIVGVQSLTEEVLRKARRGDQSWERTREAVLAVKRARFTRGQNVDLILGLDGETPASFLRSFTRIAELGPEEISVYLLKPFGPHMSSRFGRSVGRFYESKDLRGAFASVPKKMIAEARRRGYAVNESPLLDLRWGFSKTPVPRRRLNYSDTPLGGTSLLGLGSGARSHVCGHLSYSNGRVTGAFDPRARIYSGHAIDMDNEMLRYVSHHLLSPAGLSKRRFREVFGTSFGGRFKGALRSLRRMGALSLEGDAVRSRSRGMRDRLVHRLFFVGVDRLRRLLDAHNCPENQVRLLSGAAEFHVWVERRRSDQKYVRVSGDYGLQVSKLPARPPARSAAVPAPLRKGVGGTGRTRSEEKLVEWLALLFARVQSRSEGLCAAERTFMLHAELARGLGNLSPKSRARLVLKPWIPASERSGLGYIRR